MRCPYCLSDHLRVWHRSKNTLYQCLKCKSNIKVFCSAVDVYDETYFQDHYEQVYGKSYEEDEPMIRTYARRRLSIIQSILSKGFLVDVGAAYGFFLDEAHMAGYDVAGVEIHEGSIRYVRDRFGYPLYRSLDLVEGTIDVVTAWFTLEHIQDIENFMDIFGKKLRAGGCLALGLPNGYGAFARFNPKKYLSCRPEEHCTEPSLKGIEIFLKRFGFRIVREEIFGLHPERMGLPPTHFWQQLQKRLRLGDTFEVYAVRE
ncbi:class I SAM-dependent methyltransferase [Thermospira aquatica]|uniref:Class I SAM-dependent methyltransferase n=1 Tax=Thermospira aquatica TaxID=2828656 RepID=A0AAX3BEB8_9SPIR|nr:class I SAM-dependent methyltransferase [Thermospira aquatica]URA10448.1 class I SAM-dependent methyltransferase [Thermospira aquatica]